MHIPHQLTTIRTKGRAKALASMAATAATVGAALLVSTSFAAPSTKRTEPDPWAGLPDDAKHATVEAIRAQYSAFTDEFNKGRDARSLPIGRVDTHEAPPISAADASSAAQIVARGRVSRVRYQTSGGLMPATLVSVSIDSVTHGEVSDGTVNFAMPGGPTMPTGKSGTFMAPLAWEVVWPGDEVIVALEKLPSGDLRAVSWVGVLRVTADRVSVAPDHPLRAELDSATAESVLSKLTR